MARSKYIIGLLISALLVISCAEEEILTTTDDGSNPGLAGTVTINFNAPAFPDVTIGSRAADEEGEEQTDEDFLVKDLYVYIFDVNSGNIITPAPLHYTEEQLQDGINGKQIIKESLVGKYNSSWIRCKINQDHFDTDVYIYMIANAHLYSEVSSINEAQLGAITRKDDLDELINEYKPEGNPSARTNFLMTGNADSTQGIDTDKNVNPVIYHITTDGTVVRQENGSTSDGSVTLKRSEAKIEFKIQSGNKGTFTPISYRICNYPQKSDLICKYYLQTNFPSALEITNKDASQTVEDYFNTDAIDLSGKSSFSFYMPENLKYPGTGTNVLNQLPFDNGGELSNTPLAASTAGYAIRGQHDKEGKWKYAPTYATYVEIKGVYEGKTNKEGRKVKAKVTYFIHLGFRKSSGKYYVNDYYVMRNYKYVYGITVNGVDDIIAKVNATTIDKDNDPYKTSADGIVTWEENEVTVPNKNSGDQTVTTITCYKNETLGIVNEQYEEIKRPEWITVKSGGKDLIDEGKALAEKTICNVKTLSALPDGVESRTAILRVTRENEWSNSKTVRYIKITQKRN